MTATLPPPSADQPPTNHAADQPSTVPAPAGSVEPAGGFFQNLLDLYFSPRAAFTRIVRRPSFVIPFVLHLVLALGFTAIWLNKMDPREFMKAQLEESGRMDKIPADQREAILERAGSQMKIFGYVGPLVGSTVMLLIMGGALMFVYRFFYAGEVTFKQALSIVAWSLCAVAIVTTPLILLVFQLKGDWNLNPQEILQANLGLLVDKASTAKPLWALLTSFDLFTLWMVFLLATGFAVASRKTTGAAVWGVAVPWLVIVLGKVAWAAMF